MERYEILTPLPVSTYSSAFQQYILGEYLVNTTKHSKQGPVRQRTTVDLHYYQAQTWGTSRVYLPISLASASKTEAQLTMYQDDIILSGNK